MEKNTVISAEHENIVRVCTRDYMDKSKEWSNSWITRKRDIMNHYKQVERLIDAKKGYAKAEIVRIIGNLIVDEWRKYE